MINRFILSCILLCFHLELAATQTSLSPLSCGFMENKGQLIDTDGKLIPFVFFKAEAPGMNLYVSQSGISYVFTERISSDNKSTNAKTTKAALKQYRVDADLVNASIVKENIEYAEENNTAHYNYFYAHCSKAIYDVKEHRKIRIREVYPGINWVIYINEKGVKYDFEVSPGANPSQIKIAYKGADDIKKQSDGSVKITTTLGTIEEQKPVCFQNEKIISSEFLINKNVVSFSLAGYTALLPLTIDPQLVWGTLYGGNGDDMFTSLTTDDDGNVFATGQTSSYNFPAKWAMTYFDGMLNGSSDAVFVKFDNAGKLIWATYYGGNSEDKGHAIKIDPFGNLFATGHTNSADFPIQNAGTYYDSVFDATTDIFILKFSNTGERLWGTFYGGGDLVNSDGIDEGESIAIDQTGNIFITGHTHTSNFPVQNAGTYFDNKVGGDSDAFILKFDNSGNRLWATYYGGYGSEESSSITCDKSGNIFVTGYTNSPDFPVQNANTYFNKSLSGLYDIFILKFDNKGNRLWATLYGGNGYDYSGSVTIDKNENLYVSGTTESGNFPVQNAGTYFDDKLAGKTDAFILKFDNSGNRIWGTYYGGNGNEYIINTSYALTTDFCGNVYMGMETSTPGMKTPLLGCGGYSDETLDNKSNSDCFLTKFSPSGILLWGSYIGDINIDEGIALTMNKNDNLFAAGSFGTFYPNSNLPLINPGGGSYFSNTSGGGQTNAFILKFVPIPTTVSISSPDSMTCCKASAVTQVDCSSAPYSYLWKTGETSTSLTDLCRGVYSVRVTSVECPEDTASQYINIKTQDCLPSMPNVFTPNNDGINDKFIIKDLEKYPNSGIEIYNRWGLKVYESANYLNDWDGSNWKNSKPLDAGTYFYILHRSDGDTSKGFITLYK
jgi:gliding motility-associated-like protein